MAKNKRLLLLVSLIMAVGLWMYVMGSVDPNTSDRISGIKVEVQGNDSLEDVDLHATLNNPKVISLTIEGKRSQVNKVKKEGITAYIDVSTCDYGKNTADIQVELPSGVTGVAVEDMSKETATFTVK